MRSRESVGYGRVWRAARGTRVGLVPVGYADGYARVLSGRAQVLVGGRRVPVVGTISMDQLTVDLGPDGTEGVGEEVVLIGRAGRRADHRRGGRRLARHDQLRGDVRGGAARPPGPRGVSRPDLAALVAPLAPIAAPAWAVGGGVRDALMGRPVTDLDVAIDGDAAAAAKALARAAGATRFRLSRAFGAWRVQGGAPRRPGRHHAAPGRHPRRGPVAPRPDGQRDGRRRPRAGGGDRPPRRPGRHGGRAAADGGALRLPRRPRAAAAAGPRRGGARGGRWRTGRLPPPAATPRTSGMRRASAWPTSSGGSRACRVPTGRSP